MRLTLLILLLSTFASSQTQTTHCDVSSTQMPSGQGTYSTGEANCTTTSTPPAQFPAVSMKQGYELGESLGRGIAGLRAQHWVSKFCKKHPGQDWSYRNLVADIDASGVCPVGQSSRSSKQLEAEANSWHTQKYCESNGFVWVDGACHVEGFRSKSASTTPQGIDCPCDRYASRDPEGCRKAWNCK
jgi:hypothetical protein